MRGLTIHSAASDYSRIIRIEECSRELPNRHVGIFCEFLQNCCKSLADLRLCSYFFEKIGRLLYHDGVLVNSETRLSPREYPCELSHHFNNFLKLSVTMF